MKSSSEQKCEIEKELKQLENRRKILLNRKHKEERRERTHRLIEEGAILESIFPEIISMTCEQLKTFLQEKRRQGGFEYSDLSLQYQNYQTKSR